MDVRRGKFVLLRFCSGVVGGEGKASIVTREAVCYRGDMEDESEGGKKTVMRSFFLWCEGAQTLRMLRFGWSSGNLFAIQMHVERNRFGERTRKMPRFEDWTATFKEADRDWAGRSLER